ncbi:Endonuclease/exonuclease/phosphatase [Chytridium lagenaria]|nr:Endonuclease/exonuclease/phosphatase [Chytridium lagenaria]
MPPDCVFWFGDLNYRINGTRPLVEALIDQNRFEVLQSNDQLRLEMKKGNAFIGFTEAPVRFPPTYKFDTSDHSNPLSDLSHDAVPSLRCGAMEVEAYDSHHGMNFSDHKPVYGIYRIAVNQDVD